MKSFSVTSVSGMSSGARQRSARIGAGSLALILAIFSLMLSSFMPMTQQAGAQPSDWSPPTTVYIPETGHSLDRLFLDLWRGAGGASAFGYPITPEMVGEDGHVVQYFQYARFEYWPEGDENGNTVILGKVGEELRPITVQRSLTASSQPAGSAVLLDSARQMKAWLPVDAKSVDMSRDDLVYIEATQHTIWGGFLEFWENSGGESYLGNPLTEEYIVNGTSYQVFERGQLTWKPGSYIELVPVGEILAQKYALDTQPVAQGALPTYSEDLFIPPPEPTPTPTPQPQIEPAITNDAYANVPSGEIWIDINLTSQYMTVYQGNTILMETYISSGRAEFATPTGTFYVNSKIPEQDMEGVLGGEYYNVPSVPSVMYFTGVGHAIHGAYWHNNFGTPMSHGCINVPVDLAAYLYSIATVGTRVEIHF